MKLLPAPPGYRLIEIIDGDAYQFAALAIAYDSTHGLVPLGLGDTISTATSTLRALVLPNGEVEWNDQRWPSVAEYLKERNAQ